MTQIRIERELPAPGEILVEVGERVTALQKVAHTTTHGPIRVVNVARILGLKDPDLSSVMLKKRGDRVEAGEPIAARRGFLPFVHRSCRSPVTGRLAAIGYSWAVIEAEAESVDLLAFVPGRVTAVAENWGVTIETRGAYIVGACGVGGEGHGVLQVLADGPAGRLAPDDIGLGCHNAILVAGRPVSPEVLERAQEMKVSGMIVGGLSAWLWDLAPSPPFPIVATEGYGDLPLSPPVFEMLKQMEGHETSISGGMGSAWEATRPMIVVPREDQEVLHDESALGRKGAPHAPARVGDRVRVVRQPLLGQVGEIVALPQRPRRLPSGLMLDGVQIALSFEEEEHPVGEPPLAGIPFFVPWLNLELITAH